MTTFPERRSRDWRGWIDFVPGVNPIDQGLSYKGHIMNALVPPGEEGRGKLR